MFDPDTATEGPSVQCEKETQDQQQPNQCWRCTRTSGMAEDHSPSRTWIQDTASCVENSSFTFWKCWYFSPLSMFNLPLTESAYVEHVDAEGQLYLFSKDSCHKSARKPPWTNDHSVKPCTPDRAHSNPTTSFYHHFCFCV